MGKNVKILGQIPLAQAELSRELLLDEGIDATVVSGDPFGMGATVWVPEEQVPLAELVLGGGQDQGHRVLCPACGESNPGTFGECWSCGASLDGDGSDRKRWPDDAPPKEERDRSGPRWFALILAVIVIGSALTALAQWLGATPW